MWYAIQIYENGKYYAYARKISACENIVAIVSGIPHIVTLNYFTTKKECLRTVDCWNEGHKASNRYMFDELLF